MNDRIYLSVPHMSGRELEYVKSAFESNWLSTVGPEIDAFEAEVADFLGGGCARLQSVAGQRRCT